METKRDEYGRFIRGSQGHLGHRHSDAFKVLMSESRKGKCLGEENWNYNPEIHKGEKIECACGCGTLIDKYDRRGRSHRWVMGHQAHRPRPDNAQQMKELWANGKIKPKGGKQHWNWKGGITPLIRLLRQTPEYNTWRHAVYERDNWTCQDCGRHCDRRTIVAHHLKSFKEYPELRYEISNGITLCRKCHLKREKTTSYGAS